VQVVQTISCWGFADSSREETVRLEYVVSGAAKKLSEGVPAVSVGAKAFKFAKKSSWLFADVVLILISPESCLV